MRLKFSNKNKILRVSVYLSFIIVFIYLFIYVMFHTDFKYMIIDSVNYNYDDRRLYLNNLSKSDYVYLSLSKITTFDNNIKLEEIEEEYLEENEEEIKEPLVYIYNTHQTEGYNYEKLDHTVKPTVLFASHILKDYLNDYNIESIVETSSMKKYLNEHNLEYSGSYEASRHYLKSVKEKYPSIEYFIDLHRDSSKINKTLYKKGNTAYARILFVVGMKHNNSESNLEFVTELNNSLNSKYKGISRGIYKREDARFNQDISSKCILVELGGVDNTLEEINNSLDVFSKILNDYIGGHSGG